jgi:hypothetical protein
VIEEIRDLYERFIRLPDEGFEGSEVSIDHETADGVVLVGTIDAVYREDLGGHRLVDWKTGEIGDSEDQLLFYSLLWALDRDELPAYVESVSVKTGERYRTVPSTDDVRRVSVGSRAVPTTSEGVEHRGITGPPWRAVVSLLPDSRRLRRDRSTAALLG